MLPIRRRLYQSLAGFTPRQLFSALQGAWLEPTPGYIWQENTGVTPTTTGGQTMGLLLDQSQGAVLGPERVSNGTFDTDLSGWTTTGTDATHTITWASGTARYASDTTTPQLTFTGPAISLISTKVYLLSVDIAYDAGSGLLRVQGAGVSITTLASGTNRIIISATAGVTPTFTRNAANVYCNIDNISVREILGNHAYQATAANRPTYQLDSNGLPLARHDTTDSLSVSLPNLGGGVYSTSGSVYFATPVGMSALHNQSMGTTYTLPALSTDIYSWIVVPQRLSAVQESRLARYMDRKAGIAGPDYFEQVDYGPELVVNGDFSDGKTGWTENNIGTGTFTVVGGQAVLSFDTSANRGRITQQTTVTSGKTYEFRFTVVSGLLNFNIGTTNIGFDVAFYNGLVPGAYVYYQKAQATNWITFAPNSGSVSASIVDNISVRELKDGMTGQLLDDNYEPLLMG